MDDYGNLYQDNDWFVECAAYGHSIAAHGWFDDDCFMFCMTHDVDWARADI